MEMSGESLMMRAVCSSADVSAADFYRGIATRDTLTKVAGACNKFNENSNLHIRSVSSDKASRIIDDIDRIQNLAQRKIDLVIIDHLHIAKPDGKHHGRLESLTEISGAYKAMAMAYRCPVIALAQLSKASAQQERIPTLADLRESGSIEQDADRVILLHRTNNTADRMEYEPMDAMLVKSRNSVVGTVQCLFHGRSTTFIESKEVVW
jgi:replicative DNA helicase